VQEAGARLLIVFIEQPILPRLAALWLDAFASKRALTRIDVTLIDATATSADAFGFHSHSGEQA
jgi:type VI secretion system protein VasG